VHECGPTVTHHSLATIAIRSRLAVRVEYQDTMALPLNTLLRLARVLLVLDIHSLWPTLTLLKWLLVLDIHSRWTILTLLL
jgi:hypothetical protein